MKKIIPFLIALLSGFLYALGYPHEFFWHLPVLSLLGLSLLIYLLNFTPSLRRQISYIFLHNVAFYFCAFYWIPYTLKEFGGLNPTLSFMLGSLYILILNPFWWGYLIFIKKQNKIPYWNDLSTSAKVLLSAMILTLLDLFIPQQFPVHIGHFWMKYSRYLYWAPIAGAGFYGFISSYLAHSIAPIFLRRKIHYPGLLTCLILLLLSLFFIPENRLDPNQFVKLRIVQANVGNFLKLQSEGGLLGATTEVENRYVRQSLQGSLDDYHLIIWPETAYFHSLKSDNLKSGESQVPEVFKNVIAKSGVEIITGGYDRKAEAKSFDYFETEYNAVFHFDQGGALKDVYHKHILLPFGETLPFGPLNSYLKNLLQGVSFFAAGSSWPVFTTSNMKKFVTPICYEILLTDYIRKMLNHANSPIDFILNVTNDSWYGPTSEPAQHLYLAKWRALEFNLPIVRSTNTGITSVIYPDGTESKQLKSGEQANLDVKLFFTKNNEPTVYQRFGHFPLFFMWGLLITIFLGYEIGRIRREINRASK